jgi:hypothetical protein
VSLRTKEPTRICYESDEQQLVSERVTCENETVLGDEHKKYEQMNAGVSVAAMRHYEWVASSRQRLAEVLFCN